MNKLLGSSSLADLVFCILVKGVNFYGPKSEFIITGSDCGNIFLWEKQSEKIVNFFQGDNAGVVSCMHIKSDLWHLSIFMCVCVCVCVCVCIYTCI